jgi:hypothetical protein
MVGGEFSVKSAPGRGTTVRAEIPIVAEALKSTSKKPNKPTSAE